MTTTCEHGRERATCPECGVMSETMRSIVANGQKLTDSAVQAAVDEAVEKEFGGTRPLTDVEEKWVRMKHPEMSEEELDALIAEGLPADVEPITRDDLPKETPQAEHWYRRSDWERIRQKRKTAKASRRNNRPTKKKKAKAKRR